MDITTIILIATTYAAVISAALGGLVWAEVLDGRDERAHRLAAQ